jgi:polyferredoxin
MSTPEPAPMSDHCENMAAEGGAAAMEHIMTPDGQMVMLMDGIPPWLFAASAGAVVALSFVVVEWRGLKDVDDRRWTLGGRRGGLRALMKKRWFQFAFQAPVLAGFLFVCFAGIFGNLADNIAPVAVWTLWWAGLIFAVALMGNVWCFVCPWDALSNIASRLTFWGRKDSISLGREWPAWAKTVWPAIVLFVVLTWLELGFGITNNSQQTGYLGLGMAGTAVVFSLIWDKKVFCRSVCFVGRIGGMYATFAPVEIRTRDTRICDICTDHTCLTGNDRGYACPTGIDLSTHNENTYCTQCTECFKSCDRNAPVLQIRPFARDMSRVKAPKMDEAWLALVLLALTAFHGLSMTPVWEDLRPGTPDMVDSLSAGLGFGRLGGFTVGMVLVAAIPIGAYALSTLGAWAWVRKTGVTFRQLFVDYAWAVLPVALFYHLAHNAMHLLHEGGEIVPKASDPLGSGANWFGTADWNIGPLLGVEGTWYVQVALVLVGHLVGVVVAHRISRRVFGDDKANAVRSLVPMLVMMVALSVGGLWLMSLDMNMRMGRM